MKYLSLKYTFYFSDGLKTIKIYHLGWMLFFNKTKKPSKTPVSQKFLKYFRIRIFLPFYQIVYKIKCTYTNPHNSKNVNQSVWFKGRKQLITVQEDLLDTKLIGLLG